MDSTVAALLTVRRPQTSQFQDQQGHSGLAQVLRHKARVGIHRFTHFATTPRASKSLSPVTPTIHSPRKSSRRRSRLPKPKQPAVTAVADSPVMLGVATTSPETQLPHAPTDTDRTSSMGVANASATQKTTNPYVTIRQRRGNAPTTTLRCKILADTLEVPRGSTGKQARLGAGYRGISGEIKYVTSTGRLFHAR